MLNDVIDFNGFANIFFGDCDAGGGLSCINKLLITRFMPYVIKYLSLCYAVCMAVNNSSNLKDSLIRKTYLINAELFEHLASILDFLKSRDTILTFFNDQTILNSHSCADNIRYRVLDDPLYDPSCRCISIINAIFVGEDVFHFDLRWGEIIYALYRTISLVYFSASPNNSHLIFKDVLEYYAEITIVADDRKKRVARNHSNLARHRHMQHNPRP